jgi:2-oxoglutarate ferredoxin oxidoreductase subunit gamma
METSIIISGFGGQGALFAGQLLAHAALECDKEVTWFPSYGPEMRGGTAHCTVVIGDEPIGSPIVRSPEIVLAMNTPSADKYEPLVLPGGVLIVDSTVMTRPLRRSDIQALPMPAHAIALECGDGRLVNVCMIGALLACTSIVPVAAVVDTLQTQLPTRHQHLLSANLKALEAGMAWAVGQELLRTAEGAKAGG